MSNAAEVSKKVQRLLVDGGITARLIEDGFQVEYESTAVNIQIVDQQDRTLIQMSAVILRQVPPTPELFHWIATKGQEFYFGHFHALEMPDDTVLILQEHTLLGDYLDAEEFHGALGALAVEGNRHDDELKNMFGGKRFIDE